MYLVHREPTSDVPELKSATDFPDLSATASFWKLLKTLPETEPVPPAIIYFGLLTCHLTPHPDDVEIDREKIPIEDAPGAVVSPETLRAVRYIVAQESGHLDSEERKLVGNLCDATGLNRPPQTGDTVEDVTEATRKQYPISLSCFEKQSERSRLKSPTQPETTSTDDSPNTNRKETDSSSSEGADSKSYECPYCSKVCVNKGGLVSHKRACSENPNAEQSQRRKSDSTHDCPYCSDSYHSKAALESHKRKSHRTDSSQSGRGSSNRYKCEYCRKKFDSKRKRDKHQKDCSMSKVTDSGVGKTVKKDNRGERVAGKNPFADPERLKDTGLHQGGG